ncbi:hypothetical protein ACUSIJ_07570 [Pseudochelatococcus sp. B33]
MTVIERAPTGPVKPGQYNDGPPAGPAVDRSGRAGGSDKVGEGAFGEDQTSVPPVEEEALPQVGTFAIGLDPKKMVIDLEGALELMSQSAATEMMDKLLIMAESNALVRALIENATEGLKAAREAGQVNMMANVANLHASADATRGQAALQLAAAVVQGVMTIAAGAVQVGGANSALKQTASSPAGGASGGSGAKGPTDGKASPPATSGATPATASTSTDTARINNSLYEGYAMGMQGFGSLVSGVLNASATGVGADATDSQAKAALEQANYQEKQAIFQQLVQLLNDMIQMAKDLRNNEVDQLRAVISSR